ncbi:hypothetical protein AB1Y20_023612 [Prymnesium parvum]|uniref:Sulfatase N-terminal domain-containing protein n=1 Tax=Prymnesium parvum TaxID=97485 RepID=A0AB34JDY8_PRYPA
MPLLALALAPALASPAADADADARPARSNIVLFLTDDQDQMLGASFPTLGDATPMPKARALLAHAGATATRFYAHTPICCPSRAELLTGRYLHNLKVRPAAQPRAVSVCMHVNESRVLDHSFAASLAEAGYHVGMFGKFLNNVPDWTQPARGFSAWLANGGGDYIAPKFGAANLAFAGIEDGEVQYGEDAYTTSIVGNVSNEWIRHVARRQPERPFFAYIAPKAAHEPFIPARWYVDHWDPQWPSSEPRPPNWNCSAALRRGKHGNIATQPMITAEAARVVTGVFKNRWRTLLSVDDLIGHTLATVESLGLLDRTYFFFTSDHGFQLGENNILMDKRHVYDWDTRVHLLVRGPGIRAGSEMAYPATMVDLAPTFLSIAGVTPPATMDGRSLLPLFVEDRGDGRRPLEARGGGIGQRTRLPPDVQQHLHAVGVAKAYRAAWRSEVFLEYYFVDDNDKCVEKCSTTGQWPHYI